MSMVLIPVTTETLAKLLASRQYPEERLDTVIERHTDKTREEWQPVASNTSSCPREKITFGRYKVELLGELFGANSLADILFHTLRRLHDLDDTILEKLSHERGYTRPIVSRMREGLYPGSLHLKYKSRALPDGWWVGTNHSQATVKRYLHTICKVTGLTYGTDLAFL